MSERIGYNVKFVVHIHLEANEYFHEIDLALPINLANSYFNKEQYNDIERDVNFLNGLKFLKRLTASKCPDTWTTNRIKINLDQRFNNKYYIKHLASCANSPRLLKLLVDFVYTIGESMKDNMIILTNNNSKENFCYFICEILLDYSCTSKLNKQQTLMIVKSLYIFKDLKFITNDDLLKTQEKLLVQKSNSNANDLNNSNSNSKKNTHYDLFWKESLFTSSKESTDNQSFNLDDFYLDDSDVCLHNSHRPKYK